MILHRTDGTVLPFLNPLQSGPAVDEQGGFIIGAADGEKIWRSLEEHGQFPPPESKAEPVIIRMESANASGTANRS